MEEHRRRANLTSVTGLEKVRDELFLRSLEIVSALDADERNRFLGDGSRLLDVGSGAGPPGLPIAITFPELRVTLLDSVRKKTDFLNMAVEALGLDRVHVLHGRAEELARVDEQREAYDIVTSRALAALPELVELTIPFCKVGGISIALKGPDVLAEAELAGRAAEEMGASAAELRPAALGSRPRPDTAVVWRKIAHTPGRYPRRTGVPHKRPIVGPATASTAHGTRRTRGKA